MEKQTMEKASKQIPINMEVYEQLERLAKKHGSSVDDYVNRLLEGEIIKGSESVFFNVGPSGRKWHIPRSTFILFALPMEEWQKLKKWRADNDSYFVDTLSNGEVIILNETKMDKRRAEKGKN
jgi:hypothetical protein